MERIRGNGVMVGSGGCGEPVCGFFVREGSPNGGDCAGGRVIGVKSFGHASQAVDNRGPFSIAESDTNLLGGQAQQRVKQVHGCLACSGGLPVSPGSFEC